MTGSLAVYALQLGCVGTGLALAWRRPEHRPLAALMALGLTVDAVLELALPFAARMALGTCYPWAAWACAQGVLGPCAFITGPGVRGIAAPTADSRVPLVLTFPPFDFSGRERPRVDRRRVENGVDVSQRGVSDVRRFRAHLPILLVFALFVAAILATGVRGPALARCYAAAQLVVALGCGLAVWRWRKDEGRRGGGTSTPSKMMLGGSLGTGDPQGRAPATYASRPLSATVACALVVAFVEMAQPPAYLLLPSWTSGRSVYAFGFVVVLAVQAAALRGDRPARGERGWQPQR